MAVRPVFFPTNHAIIMSRLSFLHLIIIALHLANAGQAQNTFSSSIDLNNDAEYGVQILKVGDEYLVLVAAKCINNSIDCVGLLKTDLDGNVVYIKMYNPHPVTSGWQPATYNGIATVEGRYFLTGQIFRPGMDFQVYLMEFDPGSGDSLKYMELGTPEREFGRGVIPTSDGNLLMLNFRTYANERVWLQKWTPDMVLLWEQFVGPSYFWHSVQRITEMDNGDFIFSRLLCIPNGQSCHYDNFAITRTDSTGNELWTYTFPQNLGSSITLPALIKLDNDEVAVSWARNLWLEIDSIIPYPPSVLWFDGEGELIRRYDFNSDLYRKLLNFRRTANGDIVGMGHIRLNSEGLGTCGWVFRLSPQGELLWERYIADLRSPLKSAIFFDMTEDHDGSLVLTGLYQDTFPNHVPALNNPNVWLVRLDSTGCLEPGCGAVQIVTSAQEIFAPVAEQPRVIAAPNPADAFFALHLPGFAQPVFPLQVRLWDVHGRQVQAFTAQEYPVFVRTDHLPPGMYVAQVRTAAGQMGVAKVVVR